jgi:urease accessory protein UreE
MAVVTKIIGTVETLNGHFQREDPLLLTSDERASPHLVGSTVGGRSVRVSLPRESELHSGDVLALEGEVAIVVRAASEDLLVIEPRDALQWGIAGFQLGNLHRPVRFTATAMLTPTDGMVADLLNRLNISYARRTIPFEGKRYGSFTGHGHGAGGHHHDHDHHAH